MEVLTVLAIGVGAVALAAAMLCLWGQRRVVRAYRGFSRGSRDDVLTLLERHIDEVQRLRGEAADLRVRSDELRERLRRGLSRVATVRYDAFADMGGRMSFSIALLDDHGDGLVVTAINARTEARTYAKQIVAGRSDHVLSAEEEAVIAQARGDGMGSRPEVVRAAR